MKIEQNGGLNCGWTSQEHTLFTQIAFRFSNRLDSVPFMDEISLELPLKSEPVILQHITAYKLYKELDKEKKKLMAGYRAVKTHKKDLESTYNSQKVKRLERKQSRTRAGGKTQEQRLKEKEKIKKWKQDKVVNRVLEQEREKDL